VLLWKPRLKETETETILVIVVCLLAVTCHT